MASTHLFDATLVQRNVLEDPNDPHSLVLSQTISCSDLLVVTQDIYSNATDRVITVAPTADVTIMADTIRIRGPIQALGKKVWLSARVLETEADSKGRPAAIIVDGKPGDDAPPLPVPKQSSPPQMPQGLVRCVGQNSLPTPGMTWPIPAAPGDSGHPGHPAGAASVVCSKTGGKNPLHLTLSANGGRGGNGAQGQHGADGGKGGNGDNACYCFAVPDQKAQDGALGGNGLAGGKGGDAGRGGSAGNAVFFITDADLPAGVACQSKTGPSGTPGKGGGGGAGGPGGDGGKGRHVSTHAPGDNMGPSDEYDVPPGNRGPSGSSASAGPDGGLTGPSPTDSLALCQRAAPALSFPASHETRGWFTMILARADYDLLAAGDNVKSDHYSSASIRYRWLTRLSDDYQANPIMKIGFDSGVHNVFLSAANRLQAMRQGLNFFGHSAGAVPMGSLKYWSGQTAQALSRLKDFEPDYQAYFNANNDQASRVAGVRNTLKNSSARIAALQQRSPALLAKLPDLVQTIDAFDREITAQNAEVMTALTNLQADIKQHLGLSAEDAFKAIGSGAFLMGETFNKASLVVGKAAELGEEGLNDIVADDGTHIKKDLMVGKLLTKGRDFSNLKEGFTLAAHQLNLGDPNCVKLLHSKQDLDTLLDKIASWDTAHDVRTALESYVAKITARNLVVLDYNSTIHQILQLENDVHAEQRHVDELQGQNSTIDPNLTAASNYMGLVYRSICSEFVKSLYLCLRAAAFWALDSSLSLDMVTGSEIDPHQVNYATAQGWQTAAVGLLSTAHENLGGGAPPFQGILYRLEHAKLGSRFNTFKSGKAMDLPFEIKPVTKSTTAAESPFAGLFDVRTDTVEVYLRGAVTRTGAFHVRIKHLGHETLTDPTGALVSLSHEPRSVPFRYHADPATGSTTVVTPGKNLHLDDGEYAPIGPFAHWIITVDPALNDGLDLSGLTSIDLIFSGNAR